MVARLDARHAWRHTVDHVQANYGSLAKRFVLASVANFQIGAAFVALGLIVVVLLMAANAGADLIVVPFVLAAFFGVRALYWWRRFQDLAANSRRS